MASAVIVSACSLHSEETRPQIRNVAVAPPVPAQARERCEPVPRPDRDLTEAEVVSLWSRDRTTIHICDQRRALAVGALETADQAQPQRPTQ